jgi:hypothetical protein
VGRQYLSSIGKKKKDSGVVSVGSLWADERFYLPFGGRALYAPAYHFKGAKEDPFSAPSLR